MWNNGARGRSEAESSYLHPNVVIQESSVDGEGHVGAHYRRDQRDRRDRRERPEREESERVVASSIRHIKPSPCPLRRL